MPPTRLVSSGASGIFSAPLSLSTRTSKGRATYSIRWDASWQERRHQQHWVNEKQCRISMPCAHMFRFPQMSCPNGQHWKGLLDKYNSTGCSFLYRLYRCKPNLPCYMKVHVAAIFFKIYWWRHPEAFLCQSIAYLSLIAYCHAPNALHNTCCIPNFHFYLSYTLLLALTWMQFKHFFPSISVIQFSLRLRYSWVGNCQPSSGSPVLCWMALDLGARRWSILIEPLVTHVKDSVALEEVSFLWVSCWTILCYSEHHLTLSATPWAVKFKLNG